MSTVLERALEARVIQLEAEVEALRSKQGDQRRSEDLAKRTGDAAAYHAGIDALAHQLGTHIDADIIQSVHDASPYGAAHRKKHLDLSERVKQLEGELRHHRGEVPPMLAAPQAEASSLPFEATQHVTAPVVEPTLRLNEIQKREFLLANGWRCHDDIESQNIRVCWENGAKWHTLESAYELVVTEIKKAELRAAGWESIVDPVDEIERWKHPETGAWTLFHLACLGVA